MICNDITGNSSPITIDGQQVERCREYKYLGNLIHETEDINHNIQHRISSAWRNWREVTGVTCDRNMPVKMKGLVYKTIIRPVLTYGSETWNVTKRHVRAIQTTEMKMLRWMCGVTRLDKIRNTHIRGSLGVRDISEKLQESRLRWYGHVSRRPPEYIGRAVQDLNVPGKRSRGRPKRRWREVLQQDMRENDIEPEEAQNRGEWRRKTRKADPTIMWENC